MSNTKSKWFRNMLALLVFGLLFYIYKDLDCEGPGLWFDLDLGIQSSSPWPSGSPWPWLGLYDPNNLYYHDPGTGSECDEIEVHPKDIPKKLKQIPTETMHLMTVSCGRPNYQVNYRKILHPKMTAFLFEKRSLESRKSKYPWRSNQGFMNCFIALFRLLAEERYTSRVVSRLSSQNSWLRVSFFPHSH